MRPRRLATAILTATLTVTLVGTLGAGPTAVARADAAPVFLGWSTVLPPANDAYAPSSADDCAAGRPSCVNKTLAAMQRQFDSLAFRCDHRAIFSLSYWRTTQEYQRVAATPGFFEDPAFVNHEDAVFARYYFTAYKAWEAGDLASVPPAWRVAFEAADSHAVSASGDLSLGINAHVNADLPFVLAAIGLVKPDGSTRKTDHDKVNEFLNRVTAPLIDELAARFDPSIDDTKSPYYLTYSALMNEIVAWREQAWRNAERLVAARSDAERAQVAADIQSSAETSARSLRAANDYVAPLSSSAPRDAYCAAHG